MSNAPQTPQYPMVYSAPISSKLQNFALITGAIGAVLLIIAFVIDAKFGYGDILWSLASLALTAGSAVITASIIIFAGAITVKGFGR